MLIDKATNDIVDPIFGDPGGLPHDLPSEMEEGQVTGSGEREAVMLAPHDVPIRDSAPSQSSRTLEPSYPPSSASNAQAASGRNASEVWSGAIARLQTQVSYNTSMLESHRRQLQDVEMAIGRLNQEMGAALNDLRIELRSRPASTGQPRHDAADLDVLAEQIASVTSKVHDFDGLKMQFELMKNKVKRLEEQGSPAVPHLRPGSGSARESSFHEVPPPPPNQFPQARPPPAQRQQLPPMRTSAMVSPIENRPTSFQAPPPLPHVPTLESQGASSYHLSSESRQYSTESSTRQASRAGSFRPSEPLPPPSALSSWRSAEQMQQHGSVPPPPPPPGFVRPSNMEPEPQPSGWAAVNASQASKRPFEESRPSPYESPVTGSPKRPKLAPIMPRASYGDESYVTSSMTQSGSTESSFHPRSRAPSNSSQSQSQSLPTPASANTPAYRFITSTHTADSQESWRPEAERMMHYGHPGHHHHQHNHHPGHGRGRRGGRRGGRGRGGRGGVHIPETQELGTPEWETPEWTGSQTSPNGFDNPPHPYSPQNSRGGLIRRFGGVAEDPSDREHELPITPIVRGPHDPFDPAHLDSAGQQSSGSKKTRTKPIRNAEGVLIRKDGRPDMRSVSSANNLRKVHAKKEAERAEMDGRTPTSARSLAPANSSSLSEDENVDHSGSPSSPAEIAEVKGEAGEPNSQERHQELMNRILPHGFESAAGGQSTAERFFPRHDQQEAPEVTMKTECEERPEAAQQTDRSSQITDVVMRETSEAQAEGHEHRDDDTKMPTVQEEASEEQEAGSVPQETEQAAEQSV